MEFLEILEKVAIQVVSNQKSEEFLSSLFLVEKRKGGHRPIINWEQLNKYIPCHHFKMEGLSYLKFMLSRGTLHVCAGRKRWIFLNSIAQRLQKNDTLLMVR